MPDYGYGESQTNNWYIAGRTPSNAMFVPINFDINANMGYDPISKDTPEAMVNGTLYTADGSIKAIDLSTFKIRWQYNTTGPYGNFIGFAVKDNLILAMRAYTLGVLEDAGSSYKVRWGIKSDGGFNHFTFDDSNLYYSQCIPETSMSPETCSLQARNILTGQLLWTYPLEIDIGIPLTGANRVYVGGKIKTGLDIKATALTASSGSVAWVKTISSTGFLYEMVYSDGAVYLPVQQNGSSEIYALDAGTGDTLWTYTYPYNFHTTASLEAISVNQDIVLFLDTNDNMVALDKKTGVVKWKTSYGDRAGSVPHYDTILRPIVTNTQIFLDKNNKIKFFQAASGVLVKEYLPYQLVPNGKPPYLLLMLNSDRMVIASYVPSGIFYSISANALPKASYTIQAGDTLLKIAQKFDTSVDYLVLLNNLDVNVPLFMGHTLTVPQTTRPTFTTYVVKPGDTLYKIAQAFNTAIAELSSLNTITNVNTIYPGLSLKIPIHLVHVVASGETLYTIAAKYNVSMQDIIQKNGITNPNLLYVGQKLMIK